MFTGIVESLGTVVEASPRAGGKRLRIDVGAMARDCALGASLCVSGVCLTVAERTEPSLAFDVVSETLDRTTLGKKGIGDRVNLERALRIGDRLDGHFVQGHVDGTAVVDRLDASARAHVVWFRAERAMLAYIVPKGSVAIDGVSLTVAAVEADRFSIALIPTTLERTTLAGLSRSDRVNLETDIITRSVVHRLTELVGGEGLSLESLRQAGFA